MLQARADVPAAAQGQGGGWIVLRKGAVEALRRHVEALGGSMPGEVARMADEVARRGSTPLAVELKLEKVTPKEYKLDLHHWLILFGRYTCTARKPHCQQCVINDLCEWPDKTVA